MIRLLFVASLLLCSLAFDSSELSEEELAEMAKTQDPDADEPSLPASYWDEMEQFGQALAAASVCAKGRGEKGARCGPRHNDQFCGARRCCSRWGWCGTSRAHCSGSNLPKYSYGCPTCTVGGSYKKTCKHCSKSGNTFKAYCRQRNGRWIWDTIALHGCNNVHNINGYLKRDNSCAYKCTKCSWKWRTCHKTCHKKCWKRCHHKCYKKCSYCKTYKHKCTCTGCSSSGSGCTKCTGCTKYCAAHGLKNCNPYNCKHYNCNAYNCNSYKCNAYNCNRYRHCATHTCRGGYVHDDVATDEEVEQEQEMIAEMEAEQAASDDADAEILADVEE